jgi:hypothetical protein
MVINYSKMDNFHFWPNFQIPLDFELQNSREKSNFKEVQTFWEKSHKFPQKNLSSHYLQEYEFILTHLIKKI